MVFEYSKSYSKLPENLGNFGIRVFAWEGEGEAKFVRDINGAAYPPNFSITHTALKPHTLIYI